MLATKSNSYTFQKDGIWYFSRRVPTDLRRHYRTGRIVQIALIALLLILGSTSKLFANSASELQKMLNQLGYNAGMADGIYGKKTRRALEAFYIDRNVVFDGALNQNVFDDLKIQIIKNESPLFDVVSTPKGVLSAAQTQKFWNVHKTSQECFQNPDYVRGQGIKVKIQDFESFQDNNWKNPFTPKAPTQQGHILYDQPPKPLVKTEIIDIYGAENRDIERAAEWFRFAALALRRGASEGTKKQIAATLIAWASADALKNSMYRPGKQTVDWQAMTLIVSILTTTAALSPELNDNDRVVIGPWLNRIVTKTAASRWDRQDNKSYMAAYITMIWGLMTQDTDAVQAAIDVVKLAIHDMRPDGSFPTDSARSGMGLHYSSFATGHLIMMSALIYSNTQQDLFSYNVDGRSVHNAVSFILKALKNPVITNKLYALPCPNGGDRWGSIGDPELAFSYNATYLQVYAGLFLNSSNSDFIHDHFPGESFRPSRLYATIPRLLVAKANFDRNFEIQQHLLSLGYDAEPIDGIVTRNLKRQLTRAFVKNGFAFDGTVDDEELATIKTITKQNNVLISNRMLGVTRQNLEKIMDKQTARLFQASAINTKRTDGFEIVEFEGRTAAKFSVSFKDEGHPNDWGRLGTVGHAQRFQVQEKERTHEMVDGKEYWYKFSLFIPEGTGSEHHTISPFDFKDRRNGSQRDPALAFDIIQNQTTLVLKTLDEECREVRNTQGEVSDFCERPGLFAGMIEDNLRNRWLDFVFHIDLRKGQERTKFWINRKLTGVFNGDLSPYGKHLGFKFGLYRHHMTQSPNDEVLYYSDIMRRHSCDELGIDSCNEFIEAQDQNGVFGAKGIVACFKEPSQGKPCPRICEGRACEKL